MPVWLLAQAQDITPSEPASLAWPAIAGGVAAVVTTAAIVLTALWRGWRRVDQRVVDPLATVIAEWPKAMDQLAQLRRHIGNGVDPPLRQVVELNTAETRRASEVAQQGHERAAAAHALAAQNAAAIAEHYVRGHGT